MKSTLQLPLLSRICVHVIVSLSTPSPPTARNDQFIPQKPKTALVLDSSRFLHKALSIHSSRRESTPRDHLRMHRIQLREASCVIDAVRQPQAKHVHWTPHHRHLLCASFPGKYRQWSSAAREHTHSLSRALHPPLNFRLSLLAKPAAAMRASHSSTQRSGSFQFSERSDARRGSPHAPRRTWRRRVASSRLLC